MKKLIYAAGLLSAMTFTTGWTFGVLRLPGTTYLQLYGFIGFAFVFLPLLAMDHYNALIRETLSEKLKFIFGMTSGVLVGVSALMKLMHLQGTNWFLVAGAVLFVFGFLPFLFFTLYKKSVS